MFVHSVISNWWWPAHPAAH
ncbi:trp operon leader peptide [Streptomyces gobiensis]|nr:trp operon leader peptide [Streptomyces gobiensis]